MTNKIVLDGVTIAWRDTRRNITDETGDIDSAGEFKVTISAGRASVQAMGNALVCAQTLEVAGRYGDMLCPDSDSWLRVIGLDELGDVLIQIYRGDRKGSAVPVREMARFDPQRYSKDPKAITWMRNVARAILAYHDYLCAQNAIHEAVYGLQVPA